MKTLIFLIILTVLPVSFAGAQISDTAFSIWCSCDGTLMSNSDYPVCVKCGGTVSDSTGRVRVGYKGTSPDTVMYFEDGITITEPSSSVEIDWGYVIENIKIVLDEAECPNDYDSSYITWDTVYYYLGFYGLDSVVGFNSISCPDTVIVPDTVWVFEWLKAKLYVPDTVYDTVYVSPNWTKPTIIISNSDFRKPITFNTPDTVYINRVIDYIDTVGFTDVRDLEFITLERAKKLDDYHCGYIEFMVSNGVWRPITETHWKRMTDD